MLASVFIMQPLGQLFAYVVSLLVLAALNREYNLSSNSTSDAELRRVMDKHWRWVTGIGTIPAIIALVFRLTIPESGRFTLDVQGDADRAVLETRAHFSSTNNFPSEEDLELEDIASIDAGTFEETAQTKLSYREYIRNYFIDEGNWRYLAATSLCWFMLDFAYFGIQISNPQLLAKLFARTNPGPTPSNYPSWASEPALSYSANSIVDVIQRDSKRAIIATCIGSIVGSLLLIGLIPYISRRKLLIWSFIGLGLLIATTGGSYLATFGHKSYPVTLVLFILCQFLFNLGPNTLTFMVSSAIQVLELILTTSSCQLRYFPHQSVQPAMVFPPRQANLPQSLCNVSSFPGIT
jgi:MFS transporter, PHS family, inorganic phosphate transporter